jgi:hypothetical protein
VSTAVILEAIGQPGITSVRLYLRTAIKAGLVNCERVHGEKSLMWSLGPGSSISSVDADAIAQSDDDSDLAGPPPSPDLTTASVFTLGQGISANQPAEAVIADTAHCPGGTQKWPFKIGDEPNLNAKQPAIAKSPQPDFRCALFSDGQMIIKSGQQEAVLPVEHTRQLLRYLDCISIDEHIAGAEAK